MKRLLAVVVVLGLLALAGGAALWLRAVDDGRLGAAIAPAPPAGDRAALEALTARVAALERELAELRLAAARAGELDERREVDSGAAPSPPGEPATRASDLLGAQGADEVARLQALALDGSRPARDRVLAARRLWYIDLETGMPGAVTPEVVEAQLALLEGEREPELRRQACFNLLGRTEPHHARILLRALRQDAAAEVRAQAADTLQDLLELPEVRTELEWSALHDEAEEVRATASEILARWRAPDGDGR